MLTHDATARIADHVMFSPTGEEAVLLNTRRGVYYGLDSVGARMWTLLGQHGHLGTVHKLLAEEYDASPEQVWEDLVRLVGELEAAGLVTVNA